MYKIIVHVSNTTLGCLVTDDKQCQVSPIWLSTYGDLKCQAARLDSGTGSVHIMAGVLGHTRIQHPSGAPEVWGQNSGLREGRRAPAPGGMRDRPIKSIHMSKQPTSTAVCSGFHTQASALLPWTYFNTIFCSLSLWSPWFSYCWSFLMNVWNMGLYIFTWIGNTMLFNAQASFPL
jgi:hypothetical protein